MQWRPRRPAIEGSPKASACIRAEFEIAVERKFDRIGNRNDRRFLQPNAVLKAVEVQHGVPTIRALTQLPLVQFTEVQTDV